MRNSTTPEMREQKKLKDCTGYMLDFLSFQNLDGKIAKDISLQDFWNRCSGLIDYYENIIQNPKKKTGK